MNTVNESITKKLKIVILNVTLPCNYKALKDAVNQEDFSCTITWPTQPE